MLKFMMSHATGILYRSVYADIAGDPIGGLMLSALIHWAGHKDECARVAHNDIEWLVIPRQKWSDMLGVTGRQVDARLPLLEAKDLIYKAVYKYEGVPTIHIYFDIERLAELAESR